MSEDATTYNTQLASRQIEINQWSFNNKMDTLFVFQILFISMLCVSILMLFSYQGLIGKPFVWYVFGILLFLDVLIIINRAMYTERIRDKKQWNKVNFPEDNTKVSPLGRDNSYIQKLSGENCCC